jgi:hypothetical protein
MHVLHQHNMGMWIRNTGKIMLDDRNSCKKILIYSLNPPRWVIRFGSLPKFAHLSCPSSICTKRSRSTKQVSSLSVLILRSDLCHDSMSLKQQCARSRLWQRRLAVSASMERRLHWHYRLQWHVNGESAAARSIIHVLRLGTCCSSNFCKDGSHLRV